MSYLNLPSLNLADFQRGTISLWFRFSSDAVGEAKAHGASYQPPDFGDGATGPEIFASTIPLVTFGRKVMAQTYGFIPHGWPFPTGGIGATTFDSYQSEDAPAEPSHLGLEVSESTDDEGTVTTNVTIKMVFQMDTRATVQGLQTEATSIFWTFDPAHDTYQRHDEVRDISYVRTGVPETFRITPGFNVAADTWHHLLVSFDFSNSVDVVGIANYTGDNVERDTIQSTCKLWYAFDDENKAGQENMGESWGYHDSNDIVPITSLQAAVGFFPVDPGDFITGELYDPQYHWASSGVPSQGGPVGLPASADYVDTIYHVEMAEFQFFANLLIDTADTGKRRAFVDAGGRPVKPAATEAALGVRPAILLHKTSKWQAGENTGSTGLARDVPLEGGGTEDQLITGGQFDPTGVILKYKPDPSLTETATA